LKIAAIKEFARKAFYEDFTKDSERYDFSLFHQPSRSSFSDQQTLFETAGCGWQILRILFAGYR
jgi:hypothetical protein